MWALINSPNPMKHQIAPYSHLFVRLLIRAPNQKLSLSSDDESKTIECLLVLDLVPYGWLCWAVIFPVVFLVSVIGKLVSEARLDGIQFSCGLWRSSNCHQFTICTGLLPLSGLMVYTFESLCFDSMTNSSLLKLSQIIIWPFRWSWSNTKLPSGISRVFPP